MTPDDRLVQGLIAREDAAWEELLLRFSGRIEAACRRALHRGGLTDPSVVDDACADLVRRLLADGGRLLRLHRPGTPLGPYLAVLAYSCTRDDLKRKRPLSLDGREEPPSADDVQRAAEAVERSERLRSALSGLPPREAEALRLFHLESLPYAEISRRTGIAEGALGMVLTRARERLRGVLGEDFLESL